MVSLPSAARPAAYLPVLRAPVAPLIAALLVFAPMLFRSGVLHDGDTYWHITAGGWMLDHWQVLHRDLFSYTHAGQPWVAHEWLSEIIMTLAWRAGGWDGVLLLFAAAAALAAGLIAAYAGRSLRPVTLTLALALAFWVCAPSLLSRPHVLVLPLLVIWAGELMDARAADRAPRAWLAPVMLLWANLHGSFVFGFLLYGAFGLEALIAPTADRWRVIRTWGLLGFACLAAAIATPNLFEGLVHPFRIMGLKTVNAVNEWKPPRLAGLQPLTVGLFVALFVSLSRGVRMPPLRLALLLLVFYMALEHQRHLLVLAILAPMLLAEPLAAALGRAGPPIRSAWASVAFAAILLGLVTVRFANPLVLKDEVHTPVTALAHVPPGLAAKTVLNEYAFGGWLIFNGHKVFIDGRADMYGDAMMRRYLAIQNGDGAAFAKAAKQYGVAWTIFSPEMPLTRVLDRTPGWQRIYADKYAVVHAREDALP
jgi:hypothetical protein